MKSTATKGIVQETALEKVQNAVTVSQPGILSNIFIGYLWYYLVCDTIYPFIRDEWKYISGFSVMTYLNYSYVLPLLPHNPSDHWIETLFLIPLSFSILELGIILILLLLTYHVYNHIITNGKQALESRLEKK